MVKVVINRCYGGFGLSREAFDYLGLDWNGVFETGYIDEKELQQLGIDSSDMSYEDAKKLLRTHPRFVECVENLGSAKASGEHAELKVVEVPDDVDWIIEEDGGVEWIAESHRIWY